MAVKGQKYEASREKYLEKLELARDYVKDFEKYGDLVPSAQGLACHMGVSLRTVHNWKDDGDKEEFAELYDRMFNMQGRLLINGGLGGKMNPTIAAKMMCRHGYSDSIKQEISINDYSNMTPEDRRRKIAELQQQLNDASRTG